ncbi:GNAT family N-acetyltransferase [Desulfosporosinus orientis]|nr:GNAT family N-acetyltransferase [Desulfosporosinus orientis]
METLENCDLQDITEMWNRCWRGYYYDMSYSKDHMKVWLDLSQVSLQHSLAILDKRRVVGFALLAVEEKDGWIAGACIDPEYRRYGLFTLLIKSQLNLANYMRLQRIFLEVLEQNPARNIYQTVGFKSMRQLNVYRATTRTIYDRQRLTAHPLKQTSPEEYFKIRKTTSFKPAWQRRENYLKRYSNLWALINQAGTAGALFAGDKSGPLLDLWSVNLTGAEELIPTMLRRGGKSLILTNQPNDWVFSFLLNYGIIPSAKQIEMCIELS